MALYHPTAAERDACGIGFVAHASGRAARDIVDAGLDALCRVRHRGAVAADSLTGDGAGMLLPIPSEILGYGEGPGVVMAFLDPSDPSPGRLAVEKGLANEGLTLLGWRTVPVDPTALGAQARAVAPAIEQAVFSPAAGGGAEAEKAAFRARRRMEKAAGEEGIKLYIASCSCTTVTYKALCAADQLSRFYADLADDRYEAWFAIFHQRYATNTTPTWERAQPFRFLGHNGEINTIRGNVAAMAARAGRLGGGDLADDDLLRPILDANSSDSGLLDQALELLLRGGRDLSHATAMLVPPAWEAEPNAKVRDFFSYSACLMEPWDGPAALVLADGRRVAAALDRNGLRPLRISVCDDGFVACSSEAGAVATQGHGRVRRLKLGPGHAFAVDRLDGVLEDGVIKTALARRRDYGGWLTGNLESCSIGRPLDTGATAVTARQVAAGYTKEEFTVILRPMATEGVEPTSSMGDDTAQPPLASHRRAPFSFLKQRFAQVTNPPIDHLRERHVMSTRVRLGARAPLLEEAAGAARLRDYPSCVWFRSAVDELIDDGACVVDATWEIAPGQGSLGATCRRAAEAAIEAVDGGADIVVVSVSGAGPGRAGAPSALVAGAVHHGLVAAGLRSRASVVVIADDVRESHHVACLVTNGADAVCPSLALESLVELAASGRLGGGVDAGHAQRNYIEALTSGLLKIMSKMGIASVESYRGAQIIEAIGLGPDVIETCFPGVASVLGGLSLADLEADVLERHRAAFGDAPRLGNPGFVKFKSGGEFHALNPGVVEALHEVAGVVEGDDSRSHLEREMAAAHALQRAAKGTDRAYERFAELTDGRPPSEPRDLLDLVPAGPPVQLEEVEPAAEIVRRFSTGAMSHGALSAEAHETLSVALNMLCGMANTGEGGEAPERYRDERNSGIKQIASGRFGVTPEYLAFAGELQIKMAQGSKPGEGGQLPGKKVSVEIARLRHTTPGVGLISPPPHHDVYSIEDLAQLIFDLKQANKSATVSVKLVSSEGIGTIAAGVVKGLADVVHISGADGGTGASPLSSIKNAGMPWETGLAETQQALVANGLRGRVRLRVDGGMKTGRDVVIAALLGADEYSFGTAVLIAEGCILVRTCHRDTCPVGIATQNPELRKKFKGTPEMVARYLLLVAEETRHHLASLGLRSVKDAVGRAELLARKPLEDRRAGSLDLSCLLVPASRESERRFTGALALQSPRSELGDRLCSDALPALLEGRSVELDYPITNSDRTVGARLGAQLCYEHGARKPSGAVEARFTGTAGQSFGAWLADGIGLTLIGEANDYVCKGMAGGRVTISPPADDAGDSHLAGNTVLYGATGGRLYIAGRAGERFAVRNSGAVAVVEGAGDHACEYMTAGAVVILGPTGTNLGAGMSGGEAYVYDPGDLLESNINPQLVGIYEPRAAQRESLRRVIERHAEATGSAVARRILADWPAASASFKRVAPVDEVARLEAMFDGTAVETAA